MADGNGKYMSILGGGQFLFFKFYLFIFYYQVQLANSHMSFWLRRGHIFLALPKSSNFGLYPGHFEFHVVWPLDFVLLLPVLLVFSF